VSIRVSEKHGVNPMLVKCFYCNEDTGEIALLGRLPGDAAAPRQGVLDKRPCPKCAHCMEQGVILISVDEEKSKGDLENPFRTGGWVVVRAAFIKRIITPPELAKQILKHRVCFLPDEVWDKIGLPRGPVEGTPTRG